MIVGVLGLQGDFREHLEMIESLGVDTLDVRTEQAINSVDGLSFLGERAQLFHACLESTI